MENVSRFIEFQNQDCIIKAEEMYKDILGSAAKSILIFTVTVMVLIVVYFLLEFAKYHYAKKETDISKLAELNDYFCYFQRGVILLIFILVARLLQYGVWGF